MINSLKLKNIIKNFSINKISKKNNHLKMKINSSFIFFLLLLLCVGTKSQYIDILITEETDSNHIKTIGSNGYFFMVTDTKNLPMFNKSDMESLTKFIGDFRSSQDDYIAKAVDCYLISPENMNITVICQAPSYFNASLQYRLEGGIISYGDYEIYIQSDYTYYFSFDKKEFNIPFIYSYSQIINLDQSQEIYDLKFKAKSYFGEKLAIFSKNSIALFENYSFNESTGDLILSFTKKKIEEVITYNSELSLGFLNGELGVFNYELVADIQVQYTQEKQNIELEITEALNHISEKGSFVAFKTNVTGIEPMTTDLFDVEVQGDTGQTFVRCFLKKYDNGEQPLLLMCESIEISFRLYMEKQMNLSRIHYKYDFTILSSDIYEEINVKGEGKKILLNYPLTLDFRKVDNYTIEYFMDGPENFNNIKLVEDSPYLNCKNEKYIKKCFIDKKHFDGYQTGFYYTLYNSNNATSISYDARPFEVIIEPNIEIKIKLEDNKDPIIMGEELYDKKTGKQYYTTISFITNYDDTKKNIFNIEDIENRTLSYVKFYPIGEEYDYDYLTCRLWKPKSDKLRLFCSARYLNNGNYTFDRFSFKYNNYTVIIDTEDSFQINYIPEPLSFLYADKQFINLNNGEEIYNLKFKYDLYTKEALYLNAGNNYIPLYDCEADENKMELICPLKRSIIEQNLIKKGNFKLWTFNEYLGTKQLNTVFDININYNDTFEKENIEVVIRYGEEFYLKAGENMAYRTSSSSIPDIITDKFNIDFYGSNHEIIEFPCYLKLSRNKKSLVLLCTLTKEGYYTLVPQNHTLKDIHYKYNFYIERTGEDFIPLNVTGNGSQIFLTYPIQYDLTLEGSITLRYLMDNPSLEEDVYITQEKYAELNEKVSCLNRYNVKTCKVPISFFEGKQSGEFYTYHLINSQSSDLAPYYEATPFDFILPPDNLILMRINVNYNSNFGKNGILNFVTNYNDSIKNIFNNDTDFEEKFTFDNYITDETGKKINITCRFWNPKNEFMRLFCQLHENLNEGYNKINFENVNISYKDYDIVIISEQYKIAYQGSLDQEFPYLYSEKQTIELSDEIATYELKFKILTTYNNEFIYLEYGNIYLALDNCKIQGKELVCIIPKEKIEENLYSSQKYLSLYFVIEKDSRYQFNSVLDIDIIIKEPSKKIKISIEGVTSLLTNTSNYIGIITYETAPYSDYIISNFITKTFSLNFQKDGTSLTESFTCNFRKSTPNEVLLTCYNYNKGEFYLGSQSFRSFTNIHYKYNFDLWTTSNSQIASVYYPWIIIHGSNPNNVDLSLEESFTLRLFIYWSYHTDHIRLNLNSDDLECTRTVDLLSCKVPLNHFKNKKNGYYYTYAQNDNGIWQILYDVNPVYVKLPEQNDVVLRIKEENNKNVVKIGLNGTLYFVTDYVDNENIFPENIDETYEFITFILDDYGNKYDVNCKLFKSENEKMRIFCNLEEKLFFTEQYVTLNTTTSFIYNNKNIIIYSKDPVKVEQINYNIPFLYSEPNDIIFNYIENSDMYNITIKSISYNNEKLFLKGENGNIFEFDKIEDPDHPDPEPTDPEPTDPYPTDPEPTDPEPTDPEPTDPEPTDIEPTDEPTDVPTDPEPTDEE